MSRYQAGENLPYFCTITVLDWTPILIEARYIDPIVESLQFSRINKGLQLFAFVVMPNHLHLICAAGDGGARRNSNASVPRGTRDTREGIPAEEGARKDSRTSDPRTSGSRTTDLHAMMRDFKRFTSRTIHDRLIADGRATALEWIERAAQRARRERGEFSFWHDGFHPQEIRSRSVFE